MCRAACVLACVAALVAGGCAASAVVDVNLCVGVPSGWTVDNVAQRAAQQAHAFAPPVVAYSGSLTTCQGKPSVQVQLVVGNASLAQVARRAAATGYEVGPHSDRRRVGRLLPDQPRFEMHGDTIIGLTTALLAIMALMVASAAFGLATMREGLPGSLLPSIPSASGHGRA